MCSQSQEGSSQRAWGASSNSSSLGWAAAPMVEIAERAAARCSNMVARIPWRPSIARQTGKKKGSHMPSNLETATMETLHVLLYPFLTEIQTQCLSKIMNSGRYTPVKQGCWLFIFSGSPRATLFKACQRFHCKPQFRGKQLDFTSKPPTGYLAA